MVGFGGGDDGDQQLNFLLYDLLLLNRLFGILIELEKDFPAVASVSTEVA